MEYCAILNQAEVRELTLHFYFTDICHFSSLFVVPITSRNDFMVTLRQQATGFNELADSFSTGMLNYWNWHKKFLPQEKENMYHFENIRKFVTDHGLDSTVEGAEILQRAKKSTFNDRIHVNSIETIMNSAELTVSFLEDVMTDPGHITFTASKHNTNV